MKSAADILQKYDLRPASTQPGRYYTVCPKCSAGRSRTHQRSACLGITIDDKGVHFGCSHCGWKGGEYYNGKANGHSDASLFVAVYDYVDEKGALLFQVCRKPDKTFPQRRPDGKRGWIWKTGDVRKVLYRLPEIVEAIANEHVVVIVEGEKDVENLWKIGIPATCNPGGAAKSQQKPKWRPEYSESLRDADIVVIPDHDEPGRAHAEAIARMSAGIAKRVRVLDLAAHWPDCPKGGDVSDWLAAGHTREELDALIERATDYVEAVEKADLDDGSACGNADAVVSIDDFVAYMPMHAYIYMPTRELWPAASVNARLPPTPDRPLPASGWLDRFRPVEQMTWRPGEPTLIRDRLVADGGWIEREGVTCFNLYRPALIEPGDAAKAGTWLDHVRKVFGDDADHIVSWLAHRVQHPQIKINHALVLGGAQGIGKDTTLEPVKRAVGPWNFHEVSPQQMLGRFNGFLKSVILRVSEARDLGDVNRYQFYDHLKAYTAAPPDVLSTRRICASTA
jgi:hypothetical protein